MVFMSSNLSRIIRPALILVLLLYICINPASADNEVVLLIVNSSIYAGSGEIRSRIIRYEKEVEDRTGFMPEPPILPGASTSFYTLLKALSSRK